LTYTYLCRTENFGEDTPETADLYFSYGRALLENAITSSGVLGKERSQAPTEDEPEGTLVLLPFATCIDTFS